MKQLLILGFLTIVASAEAYTQRDVSDYVDRLIGPMATETTVYGPGGSKYIIRGN